MTSAERDLDALCEECRVYIKWWEPMQGFSAVWTNPMLTTCVNAFPGGARARLVLMQYTTQDVFMKISAPGFAWDGATVLTEKYNEADRLVSECEALHKGEGE